MTENNLVNDDNTENIDGLEEFNVDNNELNTDDYDSTESVEELKEKLAKKEKAFQDQKRRAEILKAKIDKGTSHSEVSTSSNDNFTQKDIINIVRNNIADEDLDTVTQFAKGTGMSVSEAINNNTLKSILKDREEERKSSLVASSRNQRTGTSSRNIDVLKDNVRKGKMPEGGDLDKFLQDRYSL